MTRDETIMLMTRIKATWPGFARQQSHEEKATMIAVWHEALALATPEEGMKAVSLLRDDPKRLGNVPPTLPDLLRAVQGVRQARIPSFERVLMRVQELVRDLQDEERFTEYLRLYAPPEVGRFARDVGWETLWGYPENGVSDVDLRRAWDRIVKQSVFREGGTTQEQLNAGNDQDQRGVGAGRPGQRRLGAGG
jgi:Loader and inhibitor of phage G40P